MHDLVVVWFTRDMRVEGSAALTLASAGSAAVIPLFVFDQSAERDLGHGSQAWLGSSIEALRTELRTHGAKLAVRAGDSSNVLGEVCATTGARRVVAQRSWTATGARLQADVARELADAGVSVEFVAGGYALEPDAVTTKEGRGYRVFSAYYRRWRDEIRPGGVPEVPEALKDADTELPSDPPLGDSLPDSWGWRAGEAAARARLDRFATRAVEDYVDLHDAVAVDGTSRLSPHLAWGEISPQQIIDAVWERPGSETFLRQIAWRDFAAHVYHHFPDMGEKPLKPEFDAMPWMASEGEIEAWQQGMTGYPFVDAAMRQLLATGWMHNRARMVVASFLTKDLLGDWREGERYFWDMLVDADAAQNAFNWQWVAGCGLDAAPYFRIFNPVLQGERFDPEGAYVRAWVPELREMSPRWIHSPWRAPTSELERAGVRLGSEYPRPMVDHGEARARALAALEVVKATRGSV